MSNQPTKEELDTKIGIMKTLVESLESAVERYSGDPAPEAVKALETAKGQLAGNKRELDSLVERRNRLA